MLRLGLMRASVAAVLAAVLAVSAAPAAAQMAAETPGAALSRYIRVLASTPRDFNALVGAGRAALELGDVQAAAGFFGRAEEVNPNAPAAKVGLGAAMAHMGDADGAIFYFNQAARLGAAPMAMAADRGLAHDLQGDLKSAQADYRLAISAMGSDEARRRLALSLAIGRDRKTALDTIQPLLNRHDAAAQRTRAFVLALVGDQVAAAQAIEAVMPGASARFAPFFRYLPNLSVAEKAAAVHLGIFPDDASTRVAAVDVAPMPAATPQVRVAVNTTPTIKQQRRSAPAQSQRPSNLELAGRIPPRSSRTATSAPPGRQPAPTVQRPPAASFSLPSTNAASPSPSFNLPSANSAAPTATDPALVATRIEPNPVVVETRPEPVATEPAFATVALPEQEGNLTGIDKLLATLAEAPPTPEPKVEEKKPAARSGLDKAAKAAAAKKAAEKKAREEKLAAEKKARDEAAKLGVKGTHWVQLAGGSNQDRMAAEYRKLSARAGKLLKARAGYVTEGKDYFRLLVGPFDSRAESQAFVNKLEKEGVDGFSWTRTPPKIKIEKLSTS